MSNLFSKKDFESFFQRVIGFWRSIVNIDDGS